MHTRSIATVAMLSLLIPSAALANDMNLSGHTPVPLWACLPFATYLLVLATLPLACPHFWDKFRNKGAIAAVAGIPVTVFLLLGMGNGTHYLVHAVIEYCAFISLLGSLYVVAGGIYIGGSATGSPSANTIMFTIGALLASFLGTTGASMLLIRPVLRANAARRIKTHIVVFFIFIVSNGAGMLTPLGDPPLFLGFLRGVPFLWTLRLLAPWAFVNGVLLGVFYIWDRRVAAMEGPAERACSDSGSAHGFQVFGKINFVWMAAIIVVIFILGKWGSRISSDPRIVIALQCLLMTAVAALSLWSTPGAVRQSNNYTWGPIVEVAIVFAGIFITMIPALKYLEAHGAALGVDREWELFWAAGLLSSFLDNAPTYLTFATMAAGVVNQADPSALLSAENLGGLAAHPQGSRFLAAVACGAVFMGANTYIGNGPNFMVKAIAETEGFRTPSFFGYMVWSLGILTPIFVVVTFLFF